MLDEETRKLLAGFFVHPEDVNRLSSCCYVTACLNRAMHLGYYVEVEWDGEDWVTAFSTKPSGKIIAMRSARLLEDSVYGAVARLQEERLPVSEGESRA